MQFTVIAFILIGMNFLLAFLLFSLCFLGMAVGLIFARKALTKGCSTAPGETCACGKTSDTPSALPTDDDVLKLQPSLKKR